MDAGEFRDKLDRLYLPSRECDGNRPRFEALLRDLGVARTIRCRDHERTRIPFGELDRVSRLVGPRLRAQFVVVFGGMEQLRLAIDLLSVGGIRPCVILMCKNDSVGDLATAIDAHIDLPSFVTLIERNGDVGRLMNDLAARRLEPELVLLACPSIDRDDLFAAYQALYFCGLVLCDLGQGSNSLRTEIAACADRLHIDAVMLDRFGLLQKTAWFLPVSYKPSPAAPLATYAKHQSLALAAIVKNEAATIEAMLRSVLPIVDFVALVDTGSADDTIDRALRVLRKAGTAFVMIEIDFIDFSQARNAALEAVPASCDWVLMLDADERLVQEDHEALLALLDADVDAWMLPRYNFYDARKIEEPSPYPDRQRRLFRNRRDRPIRFGGPVHETPINVESWGVAPANLACIGGEVGGPHIHHMGQVALTVERWHEKNAFYGSLMR